MKHSPLLRVVLGVMLLALAVGCVFLAQGIAAAGGAFRDRQPEWQRGLVPAAPDASPGLAQRAGETVLGIGSRNDVLRAYQAYRAGLANVIQGTTYPQARAQFEAIKTLEVLRTSLRRGVDRASADVAIGVILTDAASSAGPQRETMQRNAQAAFARAVREDPTNTAAKFDLEVLLQTAAARTKSQARPTGSTGPRRERDENPRNPTAPTRAEGTGF